MEHKHHAKSSAKFLDADEILSNLDLRGNETFLDAGCGDGYISKKALDKYLSDGMVYALDAYDVAIKEMEDYKKENNIQNLINIEADITQEIPIDDESVDVLLMLNVFHGFDPSSEMDDVIEELKRVIKDDGKIAIMEFKPMEMDWGPSIDIRLSPKYLQEVFTKHGLKKHCLNEDIGQETPNGKSHYLIIFKKE